MKAKKFELWFGCLGNGITVCNSAVMEHGDFKHIAHIQPYGKIKLYVKKDYIPTEDLKHIYDMAEKEKEEFLKYWNSLPAKIRMEKMLDKLIVLDHCQYFRFFEEVKGYTEEKKIRYLENILKELEEMF